MSDNEEPQVSETQIAVHWREEEYIQPPESFVRQANASDPAILERFSQDKYPVRFTEYADLLHWDERWHTVLDTGNAPFWKWFAWGKLNACYNCVDRHAAASPDKTAIIFVPELESDGRCMLSYGELLGQVNEFAALLRDFADQDRRPGDAAHADGPGGRRSRCWPVPGLALSTPRRSAASAARPAGPVSPTQAAAS